MPITHPKTMERCLNCAPVASSRPVSRAKGNPWKGLLKTAKILTGLFCIAGALALAFTALAQIAPVLKITPAGTNQISITITNNIGTNDYDLQWVPILTNTNTYPWGYAAIGVPGGTNFLLDAPAYETAFFRAELDTNTPPLWQAADPNNPTNGAVLQVFIYNPTNGATLIQ